MESAGLKVSIRRFLRRHGQDHRLCAVGVAGDLHDAHWQPHRHNPRLSRIRNGAKRRLEATAKGQGIDATGTDHGDIVSKEGLSELVTRPEPGHLRGAGGLGCPARRGVAGGEPERDDQQGHRVTLMAS